jgi:hypothetical protein
LIYPVGSGFFCARGLEGLRGDGAVLWVDFLCDPSDAGVRNADVY